MDRQTESERDIYKQREREREREREKNVLLLTAWFSACAHVFVAETTQLVWCTPHRTKPYRWERKSN